MLLELGGKAPLIVLDDADLDAAVDAAAFGAFMNQGQICMSTERLVVDEKIADAFVGKLAAKAAKLPAGDPAKGNVVLGSVVNAQAIKRLAALAGGRHGEGRETGGGRRHGGHDHAGDRPRPCGLRPCASIRKSPSAPWWR